MLPASVAAPLGDGVTVEEQLKGTADVGGIQIQVFPMKREVFEKLGSQGFGRLPEVLYCKMESSFMGLGAGGKMQQEVYDDEHGLDAWDPDKVQIEGIYLVTMFVTVRPASPSISQ